jgi:ligand-binding SRPBCC domain-containing protein
MILHAVQTFAGEPEDVFPFFEDAHNLERITPPWLRFRILTPGPIEMRVGTTIDYALRLNGIPVRWTSEISAYEPGRRFIDQQLRGPYRKWVHEHRFLRRQGATEVHDRVEYEVPGPAFIERSIVRPQLRRIFEFRQAVLADLFLQKGPATLRFGSGDSGSAEAEFVAGPHPR